MMAMISNNNMLIKESLFLTLKDIISVRLMVIQQYKRMSGKASVQQ
jgi:hypothetical protein